MKSKPCSQQVADTNSHALCTHSHYWIGKNVSVLECLQLST